MGQLQRLRVLHVHRNFLREVPREMGCMASLEGLSLFENQLSVLPNTLVQLPKLRAIDLRRNPALRCPHEWLRGRADCNIRFDALAAADSGYGAGGPEEAAPHCMLS